MAFLTNPRNQILLGVLLMLGGDFMFSLNDAMGKWLVVTLSVGQVVFIRSIGAFVVLGPMIARQGTRALFDVDRPWLQFARATLTAVETALFYAAVYYLPLADVFSFYMAGPIYVAALVACAARRKGRLAALGRDPGRLLRRAHHAAAVGRLFAGVDLSPLPAASCSG